MDPDSIERFRLDAAAVADIAPDEHIGVAVSGGSDSLALLLLAEAAFPSRVRAVSIDHGLRTEASDECRFVGVICAGLDVPHDTLAVSVRLTGEGIQAAARRERRLAFGGWCHRHCIRWLMTGHHADDQAETVLMRLARGSGIAGLAGIAPLSRLWRVPPDTPVVRPDLGPQLARPLLAWRRSALARIVADAAIEPVLDPSNEDPRFDRTRFRALLAQTDLLPARRLTTVASNCRDAEEALAFTALQVVRAVRLRHEPGLVELDALQLARWPREIVRRVVNDMLSVVAEYPEPRGAQVMRLIDLLESGRTATLAGIKAVPSPGKWTFTPAPPHRSR